MSESIVEKRMNGVDHDISAYVSNSSKSLHDDTGTSSSTSRQSSVEVENKLELKRDLGFISSSSLIISCVIGSGIFISPKQVLRNTGSIALCLIVWAAAGILSMFGAMCFAELGTMLKKSGGEYTFLKEGTINIIAFLWIWIMQLFAAPASLAIKMLTFAEYMTSILPICGIPESLKKVVAAAAIGTAFLCTAFSTKIAARLAVVTTFAKITACLLIAIAGIVMMGKGNLEELPSGFEETEKEPSNIALSFYGCFFTYDGWSIVTTVTEEIKNPRKNIPRSLVLSLSLVIILYVLVIASYLSMMTKDELLHASAVGVLWGDRVLGPASIIIPIAVMISTFGSGCASLFGIPRTAFVAARDGNFPQVVSFIQVDGYTPIVAQMMLATLSMCFIIPSDINKLIQFASFYLTIFNGFVYASLLILRWKRPNVHRGYKVPLPIAIFMTVVSIFLIIMPLVHNPSVELLYGLGAIGAGMVCYVPFIYFRKSLFFMDKLTIWLQLILNVSPSSEQNDNEKDESGEIEHKKQ